MCATDHPHGLYPNDDHNGASSFDICCLTKDDRPEIPDDLPPDDTLMPSVPGWATDTLQAYRTSCASQGLHDLTLASPNPNPHSSSDPSSDSVNESSSSSGTSIDQDATLRRRARKNPARPRAAIACPFYKLNPKDFAPCGYAVTLRSSLAARLHVHHHHRRDVSCSPGDLSKLLTRYEAAASRRGRKHQERSWFRMWDMLFPDAKRPESVYMVSPTERELVAMRRWWKRAGPALVRNVLAPDEQDEDTLEQVQASILRKMVEQAGF